MTAVATYYQLLDEEVELKGTGGEDEKLLEQVVAVAPASGEGAALTWMARRKGDTSVTYTVTLNDIRLKTYTVTSADRVAVQETIETDRVIQGDNRVVFEVTSATGTLGISDVMLWHRVNV